ncbi:DNA-binding HxlR family transcriptional regulator [Agrobacterium larrymoorei]|uniref:DNA-binding HxlR family transcriptional regulator n=1 Tax=Agrobacterium larrymoorei TaxID=160699 RepID=A0ABU0UK81_9HYPH|nr:DNA-binding HxlR family transcriptional regulator [Agrobacterium larrymoorei]
MKRHLADPAIEDKRHHPPPDETDPVIEALVQDIIAKVADKWTMLILEALEEHGTMRFTQIGKVVGDISQKMLTKTLRQMECDGLVKRTVHPVIPPHVDYSLTHLGTTFGQCVLRRLDMGGDASCGHRKGAESLRRAIPTPKIMGLK